MPPTPEIYTIGIYTGTVEQLSKITKVSSMYQRIKRWKKGVYSAEEVMTVGPLETQSNGNGMNNQGNEEWQNISKEDGNHIDYTPITVFAKQTSSG